ncbi:hypothetical protein CLV78_10811 [Aliiruegeria haliotis]|uniref:Imelysin-like domain-containing protein n=1 Tax=Aliiruegeria haliotis TaxID=1280846 RepID=A0A2T0RKT8_9RHOB|nr:imelysin family protein [Aliiruegeria haliotis]PRY21742.1 hypothetical protein CLV78_10811 [Aliiruegeria haliotis]
MPRSLFPAAAAICVALAGAPLAQSGHEPPERDGVGREDSFNEDLGLPYWAPGRGQVDHDAIRRRSLGVLERQFGAFRDQAARLAETSVAFCNGSVSEEEAKTSLRATWLAWAPLDSYQFGPIEQLGAALTVNFWPDKKNFVGRGLKALQSLPPEDQEDPAKVAQGSAAAQGLPAIERLLHTDIEPCPALVGVSGFLDQFSQDIHDAWFSGGGWADVARAAGPNNPVYLSSEEFTKTLYTAVDFGLTRIADSRLGRPLGTFEKSYPRRAEAWRSGLTNEIIVAQLEGIAELVAAGFAGDVRETDRAWILQVIEQAIARTEAIGQPIAEAVQDPQSRVRVESLQAKVRYLQLQTAQDLGPNLGVDTGFSAADGD